MRALLSLTSPTILNANEFTLTIALVVFVMLTAILLLIVILLCASKSFRAFFFRDAVKKKKAAEKKKQAAALAQAQSQSQPVREKSEVIESSATETAAQTSAQKTNTRERPDRSATGGDTSATPRRPRASRKKEPDIFEGVLTVPLDGLPAASPAPSKRGNKRAVAEYGNTFDDVPTVIIPQTKTPSDEGKKNTFITRSITITRARASAQAQDSASAAATDRRGAASATKQAEEKPKAAKRQTAASSDKSTPKKR